MLENFEPKGGKASNYILNLIHVSKITYMYLLDAFGSVEFKLVLHS